MAGLPRIAHVGRWNLLQWHESARTGIQAHGDSTFEHPDRANLIGGGDPEQSEDRQDVCLY
jgi:hypothetical protein